jgi:hypothetical protein
MFQHFVEPPCFITVFTGWATVHELSMKYKRRNIIPMHQMWDVLTKRPRICRHYRVMYFRNLLYQIPRIEALIMSILQLSPLCSSPLTTSS